MWNFVCWSDAEMVSSFFGKLCCKIGSPLANSNFFVSSSGVGMSLTGGARGSLAEELTQPMGWRICKIRFEVVDYDSMIRPAFAFGRLGDLQMISFAIRKTARRSPAQSELRTQNSPVVDCANERCFSSLCSAKWYMVQRVSGARRMRWNIRVLRYLAIAYPPTLPPLRCHYAGSSTT